MTTRCRNRHKPVGPTRDFLRPTASKTIYVKKTLANEAADARPADSQLGSKDSRLPAVVATPVLGCENLGSELGSGAGDRSRGRGCGLQTLKDGLKHAGSPPVEQKKEAQSRTAPQTRGYFQRVLKDLVKHNQRSGRVEKPANKEAVPPFVPTEPLNQSVATLAAVSEPATEREEKEQVAKQQVTALETDIGTEKALPSSLLGSPLVSASGAEEVKSDLATATPDDDFTESQPRLVLEVKTKEGQKRIEVYDDEDLEDVAARLRKDEKLSAAVEAAIAYKLHKAIQEVDSANQSCAGVPMWCYPQGELAYW